MPASTSPVARALRLVFSTGVFGAVLFLAAGTLAWPAAWWYLAIITIVLAVYGTIIVRIHPDLIEERRHPPADAKRWDKPFVAIVGVVGPVVLIVLGGLDRRWPWSPPASWRAARFAFSWIRPTRPVWGRNLAVSRLL